MKEKIKLLYVLGTMHNGGTEAFVMNFFRAIDKSAFEIDFLVVQGDEEYFKQEIEEAGSQIYHLSMSNDGRYEKNIRMMNAFFRNHKYDIIHIHSCSLRFLAITSCCARWNNTGKIIGHSHSIGEGKRTFVDSLVRCLLKLLVSQCIDYGMACSSDSAKEKFSKSMLKSDRYLMIPNAIDTSKYAYNETSREKIRKKYKLNEKYTIGVVGRLDKGKNQSFLMDAVRLANEENEVYMLIIGEGELRNELETKAKLIGLEEKCIFTGAVSNVSEYYSAMDLFCLPSYIEGFPFVLVEAQANGLKCIVSSNVTKETNISGQVAYLSISNCQEWAKCIINNRNSRLSVEQIDKVKDMYDTNHAVKGLEEFYRKIALP